MLQTFKNTGCSGQTYIHADIVLGVLRQINRGILLFFYSSSPTRIRNKMNYPATEITLQKNEKKKNKNIFKVQIEQWRKRKNRQTCRKKSTYTHVST